MTDVDLYLYDLKTKFEKINPKEYYLSYSGGKDSHLLYWFIKEYLHDTDIKIVGINTYMEHPEIRKRIYDNCDKVLLPVLKPFEIKEKYGIPCFSKSQDKAIDLIQRGTISEHYRKTVLSEYFENGKGELIKNRFRLNKKARELLEKNELHRVSPKCCFYLKKKPLHEYEKQSKRKAILGVRASESLMRASNYTSCFTKDGKFIPLYDLTDKLEDEIYKKYNIEIPKVYEYVTRTGCMRLPLR